ncbi:MAG TPA: neutral zinc metallopeptidase, partial [Casimicrobiaceae bacterium]|nr:neutral zinc metallopeptidase [Casimicrobiaceae bacterium]
MQLGDQRASENVEDRRGIGIGGGLGIGGIVVAVIAYFLGFDPGTVINVAEQVGSQRETREAPKGAPSDPAGQFVAKVLGSTEDLWTQFFRQANAQYRPPTLVLYDRQVRSACGVAQSAMGPFYCPNDEKLYVDLSFFRELQERFHAPGDFAQAYVIAHEVGHHVQKLTGTMQKMESARGRESNEVSVRLELQADCYAG